MAARSKMAVLDRSGNRKEEGGREGGGPIISCTIRRPASSLFPFLLFSIYISLN